MQRDTMMLQEPGDEATMDAESSGSIQEMEGTVLDFVFCSIADQTMPCMLWHLTHTEI